MTLGVQGAGTGGGLAGAEGIQYACRVIDSPVVQ